MSNDKLSELAFLAGDMDEVRKRLFAKGYRARILLKGNFDVIEMECAAGGRGINAQHVWKTSPMEALTGIGCPHCELERHLKEDPPEQVSEAVLVKAIKAQHKALSDSDKRAKRKTSRSSNTYGLEKYAV